MHIRGLIPRNYTELAEAAQIGCSYAMDIIFSQLSNVFRVFRVKSPDCHIFAIKCFFSFLQTYYAALDSVDVERFLTGMFINGVLRIFLQSTVLDFVTL